jgi:hypothetical protein
LVVPVALHEIALASSAWSSSAGGTGGGGYSGGGGGGGGGGDGGSSGSVPGYGTYSGYVGATGDIHTFKDGVSLYYTGKYQFQTSYYSGSTTDFFEVACYEITGDPSTLVATDGGHHLRFVYRHTDGHYSNLQNYSTGPFAGPCGSATHGGTMYYDSDEVPDLHNRGAFAGSGNNVTSLAICNVWTDPVSECYNEVATASAVTLRNGEQASKMVLGVTSGISGGETGYVVCAGSMNGDAPADVPIGGQFVSDATHPATMNQETGYQSDVTVSVPLAVSCPYVVRVVFSVCVWVAPSGPTRTSCTETQWNYEQFRRAVSYGSTTPDQSACYGTGIPSTTCNTIVFGTGAGEDNSPCVLAPTGADPVAFLVSWAAVWPAYLRCELVPKGWDRDGRLAAGWAASPAGGIRDAFVAAVPSSIACGPVADIHFFSAEVTLDTCNADFAPPWVKTLIGWILVLSLCVLSARRVFWSLGSK